MQKGKRMIRDQTTKKNSNKYVSFALEELGGRRHSTSMALSKSRCGIKHRASLPSIKEVNLFTIDRSFEVKDTSSCGDSSISDTTWQRIPTSRNQLLSRGCQSLPAIPSYRQVIELNVSASLEFQKVLTELYDELVRTTVTPPLS